MEVSVLTLNKGKLMLELSNFLAERGYEDVLFVSPTDVRKIFTEKRLELIESIRNKEINSIRDLARKLERSESTIHSDLQLLFEEGLIDFQEEKNRKIPTLRNKNIFIQPISLEEKNISQKIIE